MDVMMVAKKAVMMGELMVEMMVEMMVERTVALLVE